MIYTSISVPTVLGSELNSNRDYGLPVMKGNEKKIYVDRIVMHSYSTIAIFTKNAEREKKI